MSRVPRPCTPSTATLRRYGLTAAEWEGIAARQGWVCAVCKRLPPNGRLCTDHDHVLGWKRMAAADRKRHVRGLLCYFCNHYYVGRAITVEKAAAVYAYLLAHRRRNSPGGKK